MAISPKILVRDDNEFKITSTKEGQTETLLKGLTKRRVVLSQDGSIIGVIDNFTINLYKATDFSKIYSFQLVSPEKGAEIDAENQKVEEMISKIEITESSRSSVFMLKRKIEREYIQEIAISPDNRFLASITKFEGEDKPNIAIREIHSNRIVFEMTKKNFNADNWPVFRWIPREGGCLFSFKEKNQLRFRAAEGGDMSFFDCDAPGKEGNGATNATFALRSYSVSPMGKRIGVFLKSKDRNLFSKVAVFEFPNFERTIATKRLNAETVDFIWSDSGDSLMLKTSINTTKSYYMQSKLSLLNFEEIKTNTQPQITQTSPSPNPAASASENTPSAPQTQSPKNAKKQKNAKKSKKSQKAQKTAKPQPAEDSADFAARMISEIESLSCSPNPKAALPETVLPSAGPARKKGAFDIHLGKNTLHDCCFSHQGDRFLVISYEPVRPKLFRESDGKLLHDFKPFKCNRAIWSPNDKFAWIAGVVNMSGKMSFFDMQTLRCLGNGQHRGARLYEWSSDSKFFITACLSPWRKVDNGFKVWSFCGKLLAEINSTALFQARFVPMPAPVEAFDPKSLAGAEKEFLTKKGPLKSETTGVSFRVPRRNKTDKSASAGRAPRVPKGRGGTSAGWSPKSKTVFGVPLKAKSTGRRKKKAAAAAAAAE